MYVFNKLDDGSKPLKAQELLEKPEWSQRLEFIFPNLRQNYISKKMRIVIAFVPIDADKTILYLRFYQSFFKVPVLKNILFWFFMKFNLKVAHEDRRVVETHQPKETSLLMWESLFQADTPIIEYRRKREKLKKD